MDSSGRRKRVSARHQVKRLDRIFEEFALGKTGPAEETGFLRSVRIFRSAISPASKPQVKSGPDVFADALVPGAAAVDARRALLPFKLSNSPTMSLRGAVGSQ
jgi:hypothetical protein